MSQYRQPLPMKYRRRRTFAILLLILLVWGIWSGISALGSMFGGGAQQAKAGEACAAGAIQINAHVGDGSADATQFMSGETVKIWYDITNVGNVPCKFNVGSKVTFFKITSGPETIWDSHQCDRSGDKDLEITLDPGSNQIADAATWEQVFSSGTGCSTGQTAATAGGASYHLAVTVNNVVSTNNPQFTLN